ncbi:MAG: outer membrane protein transport protein [Candidatus Hatepunaea meridiana]|nr:outer membrane protein transport protein [Candidatus Hatepunaea meridiana]
MINTKPLLCLLSTLLIISVLCTGAYAGGYNLAGVGSKALAMSGAFRAVSDDWSAMYWNPAGLAGQANAFTIGSKMLYPIVWLTPDVPSHYPGYEGYHNGIEQTTKETGFLAGGFGLTYQLPKNLTVGFSVFAPSALGADWQNLFTGPPYGYNNTEPYPEKGWNSDLKVIDFHPTIAYSVNEKLDVGLGLAIQYGDICLESPKMVPSGAPFPFEHFYVDAVLEGTGLGFGFNLGVLYKISETIKFGASYRGPVDIAIEGTVKQKLIHPYSLGLQAAMPEVAHLFNGGVSEAEPDGSADFPIPMDAGFGVALFPNPKLTVAFDIVWTNWGSIDEIEIKMSGEGPVDTDGDGIKEPAEDNKLLMNYEDTYRFNIGADYLITEEKDLHVRLGYYFDPTPIPAGSLRPTITDVADKHNVSLGFKCEPWKNVSLEGYWEHLFTNTRSIVALYNEDGEMDNIAGDWKLQVDTFGLSIGYQF